MKSRRAVTRALRFTKHTVSGLLFVGTQLVLAVVILVASAMAQSGPAWTQLNPTGGPPPVRGSHTAVFDQATNRMAVFAGQNSSGLFCISTICYNDVWVLSDADGSGGTSAWTQLTPIGTPPTPRIGPTAVQDLFTNRMIVFGGSGSVPSFPTSYNDVWVLSHANGLGAPAWTQLSPAGTPPARRRQASAVYDLLRNRMTVYGGFTDSGPSHTFGDLWVLSNANGVGGTPAWTQLAPSGVGPTPRNSHSAVYDEITNRMIVFGGFAAIASNEVWVLVNANGLGTPTWTQLTPTGGPPLGRGGHSAVYDPVTNSMVVFGGNTAASVNLNDVWVLSNANGLGGPPAWTQLAPTGGPPSERDFHTAVYNLVTNRMVLFGGYTGVFCGACPATNDTWVLTQANGCREANGDGEVVDKNSGRKAYFHFHTSSCKDREGENVQESDEGSGTNFQSTVINSAVFASEGDTRKVTMIGTGLNNGVRVGFRMVAVDRGSLAPGVFTLVLTDGYSITGGLVSGLIVVE